MPLVSVVIPCYNRLEMLEECIDAFVNQTFQDFEIILVDDGSQEDLTGTINLDSRIRYFRQEHDGYGAPTARNLGKRKAEGKYVLTFDSDDLSLLELLDTSVKYLESNNDCDVVYVDNYLTINNKRKILVKHRDCNNTSDDYLEMLRCQFISHSGTMWRKERMPDYDQGANSAEDWDIFLTAMEKGLKFHRIAEPLFIYRTGHNREAYTQRQADGCHYVLQKRGYDFNENTREGFKL